MGNLRVNRHGATDQTEGMVLKGGFLAGMSVYGKVGLHLIYINHFTKAKLYSVKHVEVNKERTFRNGGNFQILYTAVIP